MPSQFRHSPLRNPHSEIRLVKFDASPQHSLSCTVQHVDPYDSRYRSPKYTALSYEWGPPPSTCSILVNGQRFAIRKNLHDFLVAALARGLLQNRNYWIDQLCIDQSETAAAAAEKSAQIPRMEGIYSTAANVIVWLGNAADGSERAMAALADLQRHKAWDPRITARKNLPGLCSLFGRSYWRRLWITQEVILAEREGLRVFCGSQIVNWETFERFFQETTEDDWVQDSSERVGRRSERVYSEYDDGDEEEEEEGYESSDYDDDDDDDDDDDAIENFIHVRNLIMQKLEYQGTDPPLSQVLVTFSGADCTVSQDRVYGLLGLFAQEQEVAPGDYNISMKDLFRSVMGTIMKEEPELGYTGFLDVGMEIRDKFGLAGGLHDNELKAWIKQSMRRFGL